MKINPRHRKWLGHTLSIIPFIPTLEDAFPELAKKLRLSNYFSNGKVFAGASTTYHTLERFVDREIVQLVLDAAAVVPGFRVSGFCPFLKVADLDAEVSAEMPKRWVLDEDGNDTAVALSWREWCGATRQPLPEIGDGFYYVRADAAGDVQHDYFNPNGALTTEVIMSLTGVELVDQAVYTAQLAAYREANPES